MPTSKNLFAMDGPLEKICGNLDQNFFDPPEFDFERFPEVFLLAISLQFRPK